jgi:hypothetical protein
VNGVWYYLEERLEDGEAVVKMAESEVKYLASGSSGKAAVCQVDWHSGWE